MGEMPYSLAGQTTIITGGASGIGLASAQLFAGAGAKLVIADLNMPAATAVAANIKENGGSAIAVHCDVSDEHSVSESFGAVIETFGSVDVLFNCAGGGSKRDGAVTELDLEEFWRVISVDLFGTVLCCRAAIPHMQASGGSIVNMASLRARIGTAGADAYSAAKGGVISLTRALAVQWAHYNIRVNALAPGIVLTERVATLLKSDDPIRQKMLLGPCYPEDVAKLALYLASPSSAKVTGAILPIDSGATAI